MASEGYKQRHLKYLGPMWQTMDKGHVMTAFFKNVPNNCPIWADGSNELWGIWGISSLTLNIHFVFLCP